MENDGANAWRTAAKVVGWIAIVLNLLGLFINEENDQIDVIEIFVLILNLTACGLWLYGVYRSEILCMLPLLIVTGFVAAIDLFTLIQHLVEKEFKNLISTEHFRRLSIETVILITLLIVSLRCYDKIRKAMCRSELPRWNVAYARPTETPKI